MSNNSHISSEALLNKVDKLRELNIAQHVGLPQLVVVGDQSSGKSSLLESLSGIPFPRDVNLCTRYATQISSRRDQTYRVDISIIPAPNSTPEHIQNISSFSPPSLGKHDFKTRFPEILGQVNEVMGISMGEDSSNGSVFSEDILKIEICGPEEDYLTIIDVPGIFRVAGGLTTPEDVALVRNIVTKYIKDKRTIILAVIPSNVDIATQEILSLAKEHDPKGERTLGILTKPDLVSEKSAQSAVCALIEGRKHPLSLGYYIVRNRGADDHDPFTSSRALALDQFFNQSPWSDLPRHRIGISSLKHRLGELLEELTSREFPALVHELKEKLKTAKSALGSLGPGRSTPEEQRLLLGQIAKEFESLTKDALNATYSRRPDFGNTQLRLITNLVNLGDEFSATLINMGHTWEMDEVRPTTPTPTVERVEWQVYDESHCPPIRECTEDYDFDNGSNSYNASKSKNEDQEKSPDSNIITSKCPIEDLTNRFNWAMDLVGNLDSLEPPKSGLLSVIKDIYQSSRGREITGNNGSIISDVFFRQSIKWPTIAKIFVARAVGIVHEFIIAACHAVCHIEGIRLKLAQVLEELVVPRYEAAFKQMRFILNIERFGDLQTLNQKYSTTYKHLCISNAKLLLRNKIANGYGKLKFEVVEKYVSQTAQDLQPLDDINFKLNAYYSVAVLRFMDNVWNQAIEYFLVSSPESPLALFTQQWVMTLDQERLAQITAEPLIMREKRADLERQIADLNAALKVLRF